MQNQDKINFLIFGYNGVNNTGSEAKLATTLIDLKELVGKKMNRLGRVTVITQNNQNQKRYTTDPEVSLLEFSPLILVQPWKIFEKKHDILLLNEGSTFIDHFSPFFLWMFSYAARLAKLRGKGVVAYSNDCGHLQPRNAKIMAKSLNNSVDLIMLRNPDAKTRMIEYGVTREIHLVADGAYQYPTPSPDYIKGIWKKLNLEPDKRPVVGICPKEFFWWPVSPKFIGPKEDLYNWPFYQSWTKEGRENSRKYVDMTAAYADWCVEKYGADIALISMEHMDFPPTKRIYDVMKHRDRARLVSSDDYTVDGIVAVLSCLKFQNTTRYHSTVLASPFGVPMMSVSSDTRCEAVFHEINGMDFFIDYVKHPNRYPEVTNLYDQQIAQTEALMKDEEGWRKKILDAHQVFLKRAQLIRPLFEDWLVKEYLPNRKV